MISNGVMVSHFTQFSQQLPTEGGGGDLARPKMQLTRTISSAVAPELADGTHDKLRRNLQGSGAEH